MQSVKIIAAEGGYIQLSSDIYSCVTYCPKLSTSRQHPLQHSFSVLEIQVFTSLCTLLTAFHKSAVKASAMVGIISVVN